MYLRIDPSLPPSFHDLGWPKLQRFCLELFQKESRISVVQEFGVPGQSQKGIDLIASLKDQPGGVEVGQCKCYREITPRLLKDSTDEFLKHWEDWKNQGVKWFTLFVACEVNDQKVQGEALTQAEILKTYGIGYDLWGATTLLSKLRPHLEIARTYIQSEDWIERNCGIPRGQAVYAETASMGLPLVLQTVEAQLKELSSQLSKEKANRLEEIRELYREGKITTATNRVKDLRADKHSKGSGCEGKFSALGAREVLWGVRSRAVAGG